MNVPSVMKTSNAPSEIIRCLISGSKWFGTLELSNINATMIIDRLITKNAFNEGLNQSDINDRISLVVIKRLKSKTIIV